MSITKKEWLDKVLDWKNKWTQFPPEIEDDSNGISLYKFVQILNQNLKDDSIIVADAGSCGYVLSQSLELKGNQRYLLDSGQMALGACLGMSIGASLAFNKDKILCICGDGSFQTCQRELSVISYHKLPITIFVWNNNGYLSIRNTSKSFYDGRLYGTDKDHGIFFPDLEKMADLYNFRYLYCDKIKFLDEMIKNGVEYIRKPCIIEIKCDPNQKIVPNLAMKDGKSCTLDDLAPFLSEDEMIRETIKD